MALRGWNAVGAYGAVGLAIVAGGTATWSYFRAAPAAPEAPAPAVAETIPFDPAKAAEGLARGEAEALAAFRGRLVAPSEEGRSIHLSDQEVDEAVTLLDAATRGLGRFGPVGRATVAGLAGSVLERAAAEPAPANWSKLLEPIHAVLSLTLADADVQVRSASLGATARIWAWAPGRAALPVEESILASWKDAFHAPVAQLLNDPEAQVRAGAVLNLAQIPIDTLAAPAAIRVADISPDVRRQVLLAFARRPGVLGEDSILPRLHDEDESIILLAKFVLDQRGLTEPQIELGRQVFHPNAEIRKQVLGEVQGRDDIDPVVWIVHLSRDPDEGVRAAALLAMAEALTAEKANPDLRKRMTEMAVADPSGPIRAKARKLLPAEDAAALPPIGTDATVAIPPLPGSPALNPKAN